MPSLKKFQHKKNSSQTQNFCALPEGFLACRLSFTCLFINLVNRLGLNTYHVSGILLDLLCTCFSLMTIQWNRASCSPWHMRNSRPRGVQHFTQSHTARTSRTEKLAWVVPDPVLISTLPFSPERWGMLLCFCGCVWILLPRSKRMYLNHSI